MRPVGKKGNASKPGTPPRARRRNGLKVINYGVVWPTAMIGPRKFAGSNFFDQTVPRVQELGGVIRGRRWLPYDTRQRAGVFANLFATAKARYPERSFMWSAVKRLKAKNKIEPRFNVTLKRSW